MSIKLFNMYKDVTSKGIEIKGIKTDALLISKSKSEVEHLFTFDNKIGGVKFETGKSLTNKKIEQEINQPFNNMTLLVTSLYILNNLIAILQ